MLKKEYILYFLFSLIGLNTYAAADRMYEADDIRSTFITKPHIPTTTDVVSIKRNETGKDMITLLLNPSTKEIQVTSENKDIRTIELELLNALGQQVVKSKMNMNGSPAVLNTQNLPDGNYQVRIRCRNFLIYKKVIITK